MLSCSSSGRSFHFEITSGKNEFANVYANVIFVLSLVPLIVGTGIYGKKTYEKINIEYKVEEPEEPQIQIPIDENPLETC